MAIGIGTRICAVVPGGDDHVCLIRQGFRPPSKYRSFVDTRGVSNMRIIRGRAYMARGAGGTRRNML